MIKPLNNYILVEYVKEEKTAGGLYMPSTATNVNTLVKGTVLAVNTKNELNIPVGSTVLFNKHALTKTPHTENYVLVRQEDIYALC